VFTSVEFSIPSADVNFVGFAADRFATDPLDLLCSTTSLVKHPAFELHLMNSNILGTATDGFSRRWI
jgi:hypothetical protein